MKFGIDRLLQEAALQRELQGKRIALLAHPASVTTDLTHSLDALAALGTLRLTAAFGPQHGLRGDKQDNMMESPTFEDPVHGIPVFSLYGEVRRPTPAMMDAFDDLDVDYTVGEMEAWRAEAAPGRGWPLGERTWINPSPNAPNLWMARAYAGTVMLEGTTLSEGRGTTRPLELFGAPDIDARAVLQEMQRLEPNWLRGCRLRPCWFEPTFHKHVGALCAGIHIHTEDPGYDHHAFRPWRLQALAIKAIRRLNPDYRLWREFEYEYVHDRLAIDVINGSELLREWVDDSMATPADLDALTIPDEESWANERAACLLY